LRLQEIDRSLSASTMHSTQSWPASSGTSVPVVQPAADRETAVTVVRVATTGVAATVVRGAIADEKSPR